MWDAQQLPRRMQLVGRKKNHLVTAFGSLGVRERPFGGHPILEHWSEISINKVAFPVSSVPILLPLADRTHIAEFQAFCTGAFSGIHVAADFALMTW